MPAIGEQPYTVTLPGHSFYWFKLLTMGEARSRRAEPMEARNRPNLPPADKSRIQRTKA
jgi:hypothetical protein